MKNTLVALLRFSFLACSAFCLAQTPAKEATASIAGHVTIRGKAAPGITVVATLRNSFFDNKTIAKTTTDEDGNYKLNGLSAGQFIVLPLAKSYVVANGNTYKDAGQSVSVAEAEAITNIDFALVRGGVVTGRITDADDRPVIGETVNVALKDANPDPNAQAASFASTRNKTDDRGIYRVYGLGPGSYRVSVGQESAAGGGSPVGINGAQYVKTFYPGVEDEARATIIEIKEGAEIANVDITVKKPASGFSATGRVIDADSGKPVPSVYMGHSLLDESNQRIGGMGFTGTQTDANGKFRLEGLRPGRYAVFTLSTGQTNSTYSEPVNFEITDGDVTSIEVKVRQGATINGFAVIENNSDPEVAALLQTVSVYAYVEQKGSGAPSYAQSQIGADGSFHLTGLAPGKARIGMQGFPVAPKGLFLARTELDGVEPSEGVEVAAGAIMNGVKLVFAYGSGSIRGEVKVEGGSLSEGISLRVFVHSAASESRQLTRNAVLDARLHFLVEGLPTGDYEVVVRGVTQAPGPKPTPPVEYSKQTVTVANATETRVSLVVDLTNREAGHP